MVERVAEEMDVAPLPRRPRKGVADGLPYPAVVIADHELHAVQPPPDQPVEEVLPYGRAFTVRKLHGQHLPPPVPSDAEGYEDGLRLHRPVDPDLLVSRVQNKIRIFLLQPPPGELLQPPVQRRRQGADGRRAEADAAELLRDPRDLPRGDALHVHLHHGAHKGLLAALVPLEHLRAELPVAVLRYAQLDHPDTRVEVPPVVSGPVAAPALRAFV